MLQYSAFPACKLDRSWQCRPPSQLYSGSKKRKKTMLRFVLDALTSKITLPLSCLALRFSPCRPSARRFSVAQLPLHVLSPFVVSRHRLCLISNSYDQTKAFIFNTQGEWGRVTMHDGGARADVLCQQLCVYIREK